MELQLRPDFEDVRSRWDMFWRGENPRPMLHAVGPRPGVEPQPRPPWYELAFGDLEALAAQAVRWAETQEFLADAIPSFQITFGPDHLAAMLGAELRRHPDSPDTVWAEAFVRDWDDAEIRFRPESKWWERYVQAIRIFRKHCDGKLLVIGSTLGGGLDALAGLRGQQELLLDLVDAPEKVERAIVAVDKALAEVRAASSRELGVDVFGSMNRFGMYCRGVIDVPQCDFSCMIGGELFERFQVPSLERELADLDHSIYHLDGPNAIRHLEAICSLKRLDMIQWQPGAGNYDRDWSALYARVDELGKGQFWWRGGEEGLRFAREAWQTYRSRMLHFSLWGVTRADIERGFDWA